jgi:excisionase family DNA binding protein
MKSQPQSEKLFFRVSEAALAIGVSRRTVYNLISTGRLTPKKIGGCTVFARDQLLALAR